MMKRILDWFAGKKLFQPLFEAMFSASVYGMNYGNGDVRHSGETNAARYVRNKLKGSAGPYMLFDVGANQGRYTIRLASVFSGSDFLIHAFEPSPVIFREMEKNTADIRQLSRHNIGLGAASETRTLYKRTDLSGHASVYHRRLEHHNMSMDLREDIKLESLDQFCTENNIHHIHFLKMDVEGHELSCLEGAKQMLLEGAIDFIQFEFGGCNIDSRTFFQDFWYLLSGHYQFYRVVQDGLVAISQYNERLEIFKNVNFLLERKALTAKA